MRSGKARFQAADEAEAYGWVRVDFRRSAFGREFVIAGESLWFSER